MAKALLVCFRNGEIDFDHDRVIEHLSGRLMPDNITPTPPEVLTDWGLLVAVFNPDPEAPVHGTSVCLGSLVAPVDNWWVTGAPPPEGTFAVYRSDPSTIELISDAVGSRTIWYAFTEDLFVASSSQRAVVFFLQEFQPNETAISWMLATGGLGPGQSWDARVKPVSANSMLVLDRQNWALAEQGGYVDVQPLDLPEDEHERRLRAALEHAWKNLELNYEKWVLSLSGGTHSRLALLMLKDHKELRCVTWGVKVALDDPMSDASIARALAEYYGLEHRYFRTDVFSESMDAVFNRILVAGEGRSDRVGAYLDGFAIWKALFEMGVAGVIRGHVSLGTWAEPATEFDVLRQMHVTWFADYANLSGAESYGLSDLELPEGMHRRSGEPLEVWRGRLANAHYFSLHVAPLNDLKASYVEVTSPSQARCVIEAAYAQPVPLLSRQPLFLKILSSMNAPFDFAAVRATTQGKGGFRAPGVVAELRRELDGAYARNLLPEILIDRILDGMSVDDRKWKSHRAEMSPSRVVSSLDARARKVLGLGRSKPLMDFNILAVRAYLICGMHRMLTEDACELERVWGTVRGRPDRKEGGA